MAGSAKKTAQRKLSQFQISAWPLWRALPDARRAAKSNCRGSQKVTTYIKFTHEVKIDVPPPLASAAGYPWLSPSVSVTNTIRITPPSSPESKEDGEAEYVPGSLAPGGGSSDDGAATAPPAKRSRLTKRNKDGFIEEVRYPPLSAFAAR